MQLRFYRFALLMMNIVILHIMHKNIKAQISETVGSSTLAFFVFFSLSIIVYLPCLC
jgi:hypothetical protein